MPKALFQVVPRGKLLLTGEYFVLDGVPALAVPTRPGQSFQVFAPETTRECDLAWRAYDERGTCWFRQTFRRSEWLEAAARTPVRAEDPGQRILQLLHVAEALRPGATAFLAGHTVTTRLQFNRKWGLGSSSTLVAALARWLEVDPFALLSATFGGSGYDLACAVAEAPLLYERASPRPRIRLLDWRPEWTAETHFVYLNQKQNSREGIRAYRKKNISPTARKAIRDITLALVAPTLHPRAVAPLLARHERIVGETLGLTPVQEKLFPDFPGQLKSLGAWGGDFIWAHGEGGPEKIRAYFNERGYQTVIAYDDLVL